MPTFTIRYCQLWNYLPHATRLVEEIAQSAEYGLQDFHLIPGNNGEFTLWRDDEKIYDKGSNDFPSAGDVMHLL